ncbi:MAG: glycosyltransferase [Candidatus Nitrosothermus koennekii]|nr:MAG: glycosyltransferase [Candidatus Nitrosothermus koennekii]
MKFYLIKNDMLFILALSAFIHLWNPIGFPDLFFDEGVYIRRAMSVLNGFNIQEAYFYDHPFFGQIFLAGILTAVNFPNVIDESFYNAYLIPRLIVGSLAVIDTFLIYKIAYKQYNRRVAIIASLLFAVMPMTWLLRRVLLDSLLLPFLLSSILFAIYKKGNITFLLLSGISLGLAIFTKIPIFVLIPLVSLLVYKNTKNLRLLGIWFIPVMLIPLIWPLQSIIANQFDLWLNDVLWQTRRVSEGGMSSITALFIKFDPILFFLGISGFCYAIIKRDLMIIFFAIPFILYLSFIGYTQYFHWIPILPAFAIAGGVLLDKIVKKYTFLLVLMLGFGFISTTLLITTNVTSAQFMAMKFVAENIDNEILLASPVYSWVFIDVYNMPLDYTHALFYPVDDNILLIMGEHFKFDSKYYKQLQLLYNKTEVIGIFRGEVYKYDTNIYPYTNMEVNYEGSLIEVRRSQ